MEDFDLERYIWLPSQHDLNEYSVMERFITSLSNSLAQETLWNSIKGRGAFRRFNDSVLQLGLSEQWCSYREAALKEFAIEWCEANGISYVDDTKE